MVFERLKALRAYFDQLQSSSEYPQLLEAQCVEIANEVRALKELTLENATPLLALIQQSPHWTEDHKRTLVQVVHAKVEETLTGRTVKDRPAFQDYSLFPLFLTRNDWNVILTKEYNVAQKCGTIMNRLFALGVRHPTEGTYAMCTAVVLLTEPEPERFSDAFQLRSSYITVKGLCKSNLQSLVQSGEAKPAALLKALPPVRNAVPEVLLQTAYATSGEEPMNPLPQNISIEGLKQLENLISCRSNNARLQLQLPKACGVPMMNQMMGVPGNYNPYVGTGYVTHPGLVWFVRLPENT